MPCSNIGMPQVNAFTIMKLAGHSSMTVIQRCISSTLASIEFGLSPAANAESQSTGTGKCHEFPHNPPPITRASIVTTEGPVAQRLEQGTHNPLAGGSNPSGPTNKISRGRTRRPNLLFSARFGQGHSA
jgi:hypothetical protein